MADDLSVPPSTKVGKSTRGNKSIIWLIIYNDNTRVRREMTMTDG